MICKLCGRETPPAYVEKHHLKTRRKGKETALFCCDCGDQVHKLFTNKEMEQRYNTVEALRSDERVQRWIAWIRKKPNTFGVCMKPKKRRLR